MKVLIVSVVLSAFLLLASGATTCMLDGKDFRGHDISQGSNNFIPDVANLQECLKKCDAVPACKSVAFGKPGDPQGKANNCWLKDLAFEDNDSGISTLETRQIANKGCTIASANIDVWNPVHAKKYCIGAGGLQVGDEVKAWGTYLDKNKAPKFTINLNKDNTNTILHVDFRPHSSYNNAQGVVLLNRKLNGAWQRGQQTAGKDGYRSTFPKTNWDDDKPFEVRIVVTSTHYDVYVKIGLDEEKIANSYPINESSDHHSTMIKDVQIITSEQATWNRVLVTKQIPTPSC